MGRHAMVCPSGGGWVRRHNELRDEAHEIYEARTNKPALKEQYVPHWSTARSEARLDIVGSDALGRDEYVDIAIVHPLCTTVARQAAGCDGAAASNEEKRKHDRYPGPFLTPAVWEAMGRPGESVQKWMSAVHATCDASERSTLVRESWQRLNCVIQRGNAAMLASAGILA